MRLENLRPPTPRPTPRPVPIGRTAAGSVWLAELVVDMGAWTERPVLVRPERVAAIRSQPAAPGPRCWLVFTEGGTMLVAGWPSEVEPLLFPTHGGATDAEQDRVDR